MIRHLNRLADLAFYTGLGSKTAMGMGQVRRFKRDGG
jgi:CRISPR/Cas system endoribonuclease Cas6 (RAMP superfamily)